MNNLQQSGVAISIVKRGRRRKSDSFPLIILVLFPVLSCFSFPPTTVPMVDLAPYDRTAVFTHPARDARGGWEHRT